MHRISLIEIRAHAESAQVEKLLVRGLTTSFAITHIYTQMQPARRAAALWSSRAALIDQTFLHARSPSSPSHCGPSLRIKHNFKVSLAPRYLSLSLYPSFCFDFFSLSLSLFQGIGHLDAGVLAPRSCPSLSSARCAF